MTKQEFIDKHVKKTFCYAKADLNDAFLEVWREFVKSIPLLCEIEPNLKPKNFYKNSVIEWFCDGIDFEGESNAASK